jgi:hypothetical protein
LSKIPSLVQQTIQQERGLRDASENVRKAIDASSSSYDQQSNVVRNLANSYETFRLSIALGLDPVSQLREQINDLNDSYKAGTITKAAYDKQSTKLGNSLTLAIRQQQLEQENLDKQVRDANKALADSAEQNAIQIRTAKEAKQSLEESANAFVKLGISADQFKNLKAGDQFALVAEKLLPMEKGFKRNQIAIELFGENARKFINALDEGGASVSKFVAEGNRIAPAFTAAQNAVGDKFTTAVGKLSSAAGALKDAFGLAVAPAFTEFLNQLAEILVDIRPGLVEFAQALGPILSVVLQGTIAALKLLVGAFTLVKGAFDILASALNKAFGTEVFSGVKLMIAAFLLLAAVFGGPIVAGIALVIGAIALLQTAFENISLDSIAKAASAVWERVKKGASDLWQSVVKTFNDGVTFISDIFNIGIGFVIGLWERFKSYIASWVQSVKDFFQPLLNVIKKIGDFFSGGGNNTPDAFSSGGDNGTAFAQGGKVRGKGTSTSDSILAWLSNNEFVVRARAVAKYGVGFLNAINQGKLDLSKLSGFSLGGIVDAMSPGMGAFNIPAFAEGGIAIPGSGLKPVLINFEGNKFEAMMTDEAVGQLSKHAIRARANRAGRAPSWAGK